MVKFYVYFLLFLSCLFVCSLTGERPSLITKFRTSVNKIGPDKTALTSYIRLFEPMVIKALKVYFRHSCS